MKSAESTRPERRRVDVKRHLGMTKPSEENKRKVERPQVKHLPQPPYIPVNEDFPNIEVTANLDKFCLMEGGNRPVNWNFIHKKLIPSIERYGFDKMKPITVYQNKDGLLVVVDGQHRLEACRLLKAALSFRVISQNDVDEYLKTANCSRGWTPGNYVDHYADPNSPTYRKPYADLKAMALDADVSANTVIYACRLIVRKNTEFKDYFNGRVIDIIYHGLFTFPVGMREILTHCLKLFKEVKACLPGHIQNKENFKKAMLQVILHKSYSQRRMLIALHKRAGDLKPASRLAAYRDNIITVYNAHIPKKDQINPQDFETLREEDAREVS